MAETKSGCDEVLFACSRRTEQHIARLRRQDSGAEDLELTSSQENTKITAIDKEDRNLPKKKRYSMSQDKEYITKIVGMMHWQYNQFPYPPLGQGGTHKLENNYIPEVFPWEWEFEVPCQPPHPGSIASGEGAPRALGFEGQQISEAWQDWGKRRLHSWRMHTRSHVHWDPGQEQRLQRSLGQTYLLVLEGLLRR